MFGEYIEKIKKRGGWKFLEKVPPDFWSEKKLQNLLLALEEEQAGVLTLKSRPYHLVIEPTNICNLKCPLCSTGVASAQENTGRTKGILSVERFQQLIDDCGDTIIDLYLQNWGEPTLVKHLPEMLQYATQRGIWIYLSTNFSLPHSDEYLERLMDAQFGLLHVDIEGTTQESYQQYRVGGKLEMVLKNVRQCVEIKKRKGYKYPVIEGTMLVMRHNEHQIEEFKKLAESLGLDQWTLGKIQLNPNVDTDLWLPENPQYKYATYEEADPLKVQPCHWPWSGMVINYDGNVSPCCIIDDKKADFANVFTDSGVMGVWNSQKYVSARAEFVDHSKITSPNICNLCKNQTHKPELKRFKNTYSLMLDEQRLREQFPQLVQVEES